MPNPTIENYDRSPKQPTPITASCKVEGLQKEVAKANEKAAKASEAKKKMKGQLDAANETIRLLEAQIEKANSKKANSTADTDRVRNALSTIKVLSRLKPGVVSAEECLGQLKEELSEEFTLAIEHQS